VQCLLQGLLVLGINFEEGFNVIFFLMSSLTQKLHYIIIMQHPTLTLIVRYPNDTLHLATQDHLKSKVIIKCESCGQIEVVQKHTRDSVCKSCGFQSKIEAAKGQNCRKQSCNGELKLMIMATGMMV
jgi:ribosomal protein L32